MSIRPLFRAQYFPRWLLMSYGLLFVTLAIHPYDRHVWWAENIPIVVLVFLLAILYKRGVQFSNLSYLLMSALVFLHTIGGHYTFERVPFEWFNSFFGFERNMYDRIAHFTVGFYAFPLAEILSRYHAVHSRLVFYLFPIFAIAFVAMSYEIIEWLFAVMSNPNSGLAFLGSQGDIWDAQKDMLADTLGAITSLGLYFLVRDKRQYSI
jgi:putative membrane protein